MLALVGIKMVGVTEGDCDLVEENDIREGDDEWGPGSRKSEGHRTCTYVSAGLCTQKLPKLISKHASIEDRKCPP